jgi:NADPH:quinone reductase-like Zn-dependent oxidoreductase
VIAEDGPGAVQLSEIPEPDGERLIGVRAAEVSFPDLLMTRSGYQIRQPLPFTLGAEATGEVVKAPAGGPLGTCAQTLRPCLHRDVCARLAVERAHPPPDC